MIALTIEIGREERDQADQHRAAGQRAGTAFSSTAIIVFLLRSTEVIASRRTLAAARVIEMKLIGSSRPDGPHSR